MERICRYENNEISKEVDKTRNTYSYIVNDTIFDSMHWVDIFMLQVLIYFWRKDDFRNIGIELVLEF